MRLMLSPRIETTRECAHIGRCIQRTIRLTCLVHLALFTLLLAGGCGGGSDEQTSPPDQQQSQTVSDQIEPMTSLNPELSQFMDFIRQNRTDIARVRIRKHLALHPDDGQAHFLFGLTYHREQRYGKAIAAFDQALEQDPAFVTTRYFRGWALYSLGRIDEAREDLNTHLKAEPDSADTLFALGLIAMEEGDLSGAHERFTNSLRLLDADDPSTAKQRSKAMTRLADVALAQGREDDVESLLLNATALFPDHYEAFYKLFRLYQAHGRDEDAARAEQSFRAARQRVHPDGVFPE